eukprot:gb/GECG01009061.1/.p1 GENE.gb/GECG01009061.1/~~gb/GECG01009061.1/.p1  ORF type:complete len:183 (+),score=12.90 gb/GECG01009061.1/:1-549(+)
MCSSAERSKRGWNLRHIRSRTYLSLILVGPEFLLIRFFVLAAGMNFRVGCFRKHALIAGSAFASAILVVTLVLVPPVINSTIEIEEIEDNIQPNMTDLNSRVEILEKDQHELWRTVNQHAATHDSVQSELYQTRSEMRQIEARFTSTQQTHSKEIQKVTGHASDLDSGFQMFWKKFEESQIV